MVRLVERFLSYRGKTWRWAGQFAPLLVQIGFMTPTTPLQVSFNVTPTPFTIPASRPPIKILIVHDSQTAAFNTAIKMENNSLYLRSHLLLLYSLYSLEILEIIVAHPVIVLYFCQRGTGSVCLKQKVEKDVCRLNSMVLALKL